MKTILHTDGGVSLVIGNKTIYAGRRYQDESKAWRARPRGLYPLDQSFKTENEAVDALRDFHRQGSPVRRSILNAPLSTQRGGNTHKTPQMPSQPARNNAPRRQSIRKQAHQQKPAGQGELL